jgi:DNA-binding NtrC family response regulator
MVKEPMQAPFVAGHDPDLVPLDEIERRHILGIVDHCGGNRTEAAKILQIDRKTLHRKLLRWGVRREP